jgi:hypothetical protein
MPEAIVRLETDIRSLCEHDAGPRDPVGLLAVNQVPHDIEWTERVGTFSASRPRGTHVLEEGPEGGGRTLEDLYGKVKLEVHDFVATA